MLPMATPKHARELSDGQHRLALIITVTACALAPVFFAVMFESVVHLLGPSFWWAWAVPVATEASFVILFMLDVLLEWCGKPMGWLRWAPYPFAAASLWLNVYSAKGDTAAMVGHGVVTVAFFLPLLAAKAAVRKLSVSDEDVSAGRRARRGAALRDGSGARPEGHRVAVAHPVAAAYSDRQGTLPCPRHDGRQ